MGPGEKVTVGTSARRVLLIHEPPDGGVAYHVVLLAEGLAHHGYQPEVAGPDGGLFRDRLVSSGIPYHPIPFTRANNNPLRELRAVFALTKLMRRERFSLVHCHSSKAGVHGRLAAALSRTPAVYTPHCFGFIGPVSRKRRWGAAAVEWLLAPLTNKILCVSRDELREAFKVRLPRRRLVLTLQGIPDRSSEAPTDPLLTAMRAKGPTVGVVNALRKAKRVDLFLAAIPEVWKSRPDVNFVVAGAGPLEQELRAQANLLGLQEDDRFAFLSYMPPSDRYLSGLDALVLPSDWEGLSIGLIEAQAAGVPQIVSDLAANLEVVTAQTGLVFPRGSEEFLAQAILELIDDPQRSDEMRRQSAVRAHREFRFDRMLSEIETVYERCLRR